MKYAFIGFLSLFLLSSDMPAYTILGEKGDSVSFTELVKEASGADVVLFGELHDNPIAHWLQLELTRALYEKKKDKLVLGAEMFESDNQLLIDEYLAGEVSERSFEREARLWSNYRTDYKPLMTLAKEKGLRFVASNIPRRYASKVATEGLSSLEKLGAASKAYIAPLPVEVDSTLPGYHALLSMGMGPHGSGENFMCAQAIKDATMAHFILENLGKKQTLIHYNGAYHSNNFEGINWYLKQKKPSIKIVTISCVESAEVGVLDDESAALANFIISIDEDITKTH